MTFVTIGAMLAAIAMVASYLPAPRGMQVDRAVTLKAE
jgi:ABC-type lipoprotein release transport system permease subunit